MYWLCGRWKCRDNVRLLRQLSTERKNAAEDWQLRVQGAADRVVERGTSGALVLRRLRIERNVANAIGPYLTQREGDAWCRAKNYGAALAAYKTAAATAGDRVGAQWVMSSTTRFIACGERIWAEQLLEDVLGPTHQQDVGHLSLLVRRAELLIQRANADKPSEDESRNLRQRAQTDLERVLHAAQSGDDDRWNAATLLLKECIATEDIDARVEIWKSFCRFPSRHQARAMQHWWSLLSASVQEGSPACLTQIHSYIVCVRDSDSVSDAHCSEVLARVCSHLSNAKRLDAIKLLLGLSAIVPGIGASSGVGVADEKRARSTLPLAAALIAPVQEADEWFVLACEAALSEWPTSPEKTVDLLTNILLKARRPERTSWRAHPWITEVLNELAQAELLKRMRVPLSCFKVLGYAFSCAPIELTEESRQRVTRAVEEALSPGPRSRCDDSFDDAADGVMNIAGVERRMRGLLWLAEVAHSVERNATAEAFILAARNSLQTYSDVQVGSRLVFEMCKELGCSALSLAFPELFETMLFEASQRCLQMSQYQDGVRPEVSRELRMLLLKFDELRETWEYRKRTSLACSAGA